MNFDSYITSSTKTAFTVGVNQKLIKYNKFNLKKTAFTLAETLITLTIIGVIAALTIPTLISKYQKHTYVVGLKKAYSQLQNAMKMIPITQGCPPGDFDCVGWNEYGHYDENGQWVSDVTNIEGQEFNGNIHNKQTYLLSKQFKINKLCYENSNDKMCEQARNNMHMGSYPIIITNDGTAYSTFYGYAVVDVNGSQGPNKDGRDIFYFSFSNDYAVIPWGSKLYADLFDSRYYWRLYNTCNFKSLDYGNWDARYCTGRVLEEDAMNY